MTQDYSNGSGPVEPQVATIVYRRADGEVAAIHYFGTLPGVPLPTNAELETLALARARADGLAEGGALAVLYVDPCDIAQRTVYRVCLETCRLVAVEAGNGSLDNLL